jgi:hypothetical protein
MLTVRTMDLAIVEELQSERVIRPRTGVVNFNVTYRPLYCVDVSIRARRLQTAILPAEL